MKFICLGSAAAAVPSTCVLWEFLGELMQMAHSQNHQILANYWDLAYAALDGPQPKNIKFWHTTGIRRGPYLCSLHAWAVQKPPYHLRWLTAKNIKLWLTTGIRRGPPTYVDYMLGQCSSHHTIYFCLMGTARGAYTPQDGP